MGRVVGSIPIEVGDFFPYIPELHHLLAKMGETTSFHGFENDRADVGYV